MFRFEGLEVWKKSIELSDTLFDIAQRTDELKYYRFSEQLHGATLSISNNIAEGSASPHNKEFAQFLNIARRSAFECVNILIIFERRSFISGSELKQLKDDLYGICGMLTNLRKSLLS